MNRNLGDSTLALSGPLAFAVAVVVAGRRLPGYHHRDEPVSALAARDMASGPVMMSGFVGLGIGTLALSHRLRTRGPGSSIGTMMALSGVTTIGAGLFRCSDRTCPSRAFGDTNADAIDELHGVCSMLSFILWIAMPLTAARHAGSSRHGVRWASRSIATAAIVSGIAAGFLAARHSPRYQGVAQRIMIGVALSWFPIAPLTRTGQR